jgi:feruloyl-CoA synthase
MPQWNFLERARMFARMRITAEQTADGTLLRSTDELRDHPVSVLHSLRQWAATDPGHPLVAERDPDGAWRTVGYGGAVAAANAIGQALLDRGLGPARPLLLLSGNGVNHLLMTLGAMTAGIPVAPVSVAYSLQSRDHARISAVAALISPGAVYADDASAFGPALDAAGAAPIVAAGTRPGATPLAELLDTTPGAAVRGAFDTLTPDVIAKILFTSGSTGTRKGVLNTHRMLASNQQMIRQAWPFLADERPVIVDWLPWSHTFGGNHNVNLCSTRPSPTWPTCHRPSTSTSPRAMPGWSPHSKATRSSRPASSPGCGCCSTPRRRCPARSAPGSRPSPRGTRLTVMSR